MEDDEIKGDDSFEKDDEGEEIGLVGRGGKRRNGEERRGGGISTVVRGHILRSATFGFITELTLKKMGILCIFMSTLKYAVYVSFPVTFVLAFPILG